MARNLSKRTKIDRCRMGRSLLPSLRGYRRDWLPKDAAAGVLITAIAIPLSMGMAEVAGLPPIVGLYSCVLPLVAFALIGSSRRLVIALDASTAAMLAAAIAPLARGDSARYLALATTITLLVGFILILAGVGRLGLVADLLSRPVLLGYQAGLAVLVIVTQLPQLLGVDPQEGAIVGAALRTARAVGWASLPTIAVSAICLTGMVLLRRWRPSWPAPVIVVAATTLIVSTLDLADSVDVVGAVPAGLAHFRLPSVGLRDTASLFIPAAAIALIAAADTLVTARAFAARNADDVNANRDLVGLGAANVASAVSGGMTTSASAARTAVAESSGSQSQLAGVFAAAAMMLVLLFLTGPLSLVPRAALASVVLLAVVRLIEVTRLRRLWSIHRSEFGIAVVTFASVVTVGLLPAIIVAIVLSLVDTVRRGMAPAEAISAFLERDGHLYCDESQDAIGATSDPTVAMYRFSAPLFYGNAERFRTGIHHLIAARPQTSLALVDASRIPFIDATGTDIVIELEREYSKSGIDLVLVGLAGAARNTLDRDRTLEALATSTTSTSVSDVENRGAQIGDRRQARARRWESG